MASVKAFIRKWFPVPEDYSEKRLFSLDLLRGLDMLLLTVLEPLISGLQNTFKCFPESVMGQLTHNWLGFTLYDIIMPLFIFMCGAAIPFSLGRRLKEGKLVFLRHVLGRVVLLWFLGGCVQGNWLAFDPHTFCPYANTLQAIAFGYLATALMMMVPGRVFQYALPIALTAGYGVLLGCNFTETDNLALTVDRAFRGALVPADNTFCDAPYTWVLTSMMFAAMTMCGYHATRILVGAGTAWRKTSVLSAYGAVLLGAGWVAAIWIPVAKPVYSISFTLQAMGWCVLALASLYVLTDIYRFRRGTSLALLFGQFALTAYIIRELFAGVLIQLATTVGSGLDRLFHGGGAYGIVIQLIVALELIAAVALWRRFKMAK